MPAYVAFPSWLRPEIIPFLPVRWYGLMYDLVHGGPSRKNPKACARGGSKLSQSPENEEDAEMSTQFPAPESAVSIARASEPRSRTHRLSPTIFLLPVALGIVGAALLLAAYLAVLGLSQSWAHAIDFLRADAYLVAPIVLSFGVQVGLYTYLRAIIRARSRASGVLTGAGGATSAAAMAACCAHHAADLLPFLGLSAAAGFLSAYRVPFMVLGLAVSLAGVALMLRRIVLYRKMHMHVEPS